LKSAKHDKMVESTKQNGLIPHYPVTNHKLTYECPDIYLDHHVMDLKFSPTQNIMVIGQVTGHLRIYAFTEEVMEEVLDMTHHTDSVRSVDYNPAGNIVYASSTDGSFSVISNGRLEGHLTEAHKQPINKIIHIENDHVVATGDDDGHMKIWDLRMATKGKKDSCVLSFDEHEGTITDMVYSTEK